MCYRQLPEVSSYGSFLFVFPGAVGAQGGAKLPPKTSQNRWKTNAKPSNTTLEGLGQKGLVWFPKKKNLVALGQRTEQGFIRPYEALA